MTPCSYSIINRPGWANDKMNLSAKEAKELMPRGYQPSDAIFCRIKSSAEAGLTNIYTDLTLGQVDEFKGLGYKVEYNEWGRNYKIEWK
jgi:hypothetical protein